MSVRRRALAWMTLGLTVIGLVAAAVAYAIDTADADRLLDGELRLIAFYAGPNLSAHSARAQIYNGNHDILIDVID